MISSVGSSSFGLRLPVGHCFSSGVSTTGLSFLPRFHGAAAGSSSAGSSTIGFGSNAISSGLETSASTGFFAIGFNEASSGLTSSSFGFLGIGFRVISSVGSSTLGLRLPVGHCFSSGTSSTGFSFLPRLHGAGAGSSTTVCSTVGSGTTVISSGLIRFSST